MHRNAEHWTEKLNGLREVLKTRLYYDTPGDYEAGQLIKLIDLAYCMRQSRLARAGLRRLTEQQLFRAAEHFFRRRNGQSMWLSRVQIPWDTNNVQSDPLCYIWELVGEQVVMEHVWKNETA